MGEQLKDVQLIILKPNGEQIKIENANIVGIEEKIKQDTFALGYFPGNYENIVTRKTIEITIETKNLSKKRFIKLLMAKGIARNGAKDLAEYIRKKYGNYNEKYLLLYN